MMRVRRVSAWALATPWMMAWLAGGIAAQGMVIQGIAASGAKAQEPASGAAAASQASADELPAIVFALTRERALRVAGAGLMTGDGNDVEARGKALRGRFASVRAAAKGQLTELENKVLMISDAEARQRAQRLLDAHRAQTSEQLIPMADAALRAEEGSAASVDAAIASLNTIRGGTAAIDSTRRVLLAAMLIGRSASQQDMADAGDLLESLLDLPSGDDALRQCPPEVQDWARLLLLRQPELRPGLLREVNASVATRRQWATAGVLASILAKLQGLGCVTSMNTPSRAGKADGAAVDGAIAPLVRLLAEAEARGAAREGQEAMAALRVVAAAIAEEQRTLTLRAAAGLGVDGVFKSLELASGVITDPAFGGLDRALRRRLVLAAGRVLSDAPEAAVSVEAIGVLARLGDAEAKGIAAGLVKRALRGATGGEAEKRLLSVLTSSEDPRLAWASLVLATRQSQAAAMLSAASRIKTAGGESDAELKAMAAMAIVRRLGEEPMTRELAVALDAGAGCIGEAPLPRRARLVRARAELRAGDAEQAGRSFDEALKLACAPGADAQGQGAVERARWIEALREAGREEDALKLARVLTSELPTLPGSTQTEAREAFWLAWTNVLELLSLEKTNRSDVLLRLRALRAQEMSLGTTITRARLEALEARLTK